MVSSPLSGGEPGFEPVEQREVPVAPERLGDVAIGGRALVLECLEQACRALTVCPERLDLLAETAEHDVEVPRRPEVPAEPAELLAERLGPAPVDERSRGAQEGPQPPRRDAKLVEVLGIVAAARPRIVCEQRPVVALESVPSASTGGVPFLFVGVSGVPARSSAR